MNFVQLMEIYDDVFSPVYFMFLCALVVVYYDSKRTGKLKQGLAIAFAAYAIAYVTYSTWYFISQMPQWVEDFLAVTGLMLGVLMAMVAMVKKIYDGIVREAVYIIVVLSAPYMAISPFWNISGHVAYTTAPALYLVTLNRKFLPLMLIPIIMVINRPVIGAHTVAQSVAGFILAALVVVVGTHLYRKRRKLYL